MARSFCHSFAKVGVILPLILLLAPPPSPHIFRPSCGPVLFPHKLCIPSMYRILALHTQLYRVRMRVNTKFQGISIIRNIHHQLKQTFKKIVLSSIFRTCTIITLSRIITSFKYKPQFLVSTKKSPLYCINCPGSWTL